MEMDLTTIFGILLLLNGNAAIRLRGCINNEYVNIEEDSQDPVICEDLDPQKTVTWFIKGGKWSVLTSLGECKTSETCSSSDDDVRITRSASQSNLTILHDHRDFGQVTIACGYERFDNGYSCQIRVVRSAKPTMCNIFTHKQGNAEIVYGSCYIDKTFTSDNHYMCQWQHTYPKLDDQPLPLASVFITTPYREAGRVYYKTTCAFSSPVFTVNGTYKFYVSLSPGLAQQQVGTLHIPYTTQQQHSIAKPLTVPATSNSEVTLTCRSASRINTPKWIGATCIQGNQKETCILTPNPSSDEGKVITCSAYFLEQTFVGREVNASFRLNLDRNNPFFTLFSFPLLVVKIWYICRSGGH